jgi:hypothetical protein
MGEVAEWSKARPKLAGVRVKSPSRVRQNRRSDSGRAQRARQGEGRDGLSHNPAQRRIGRCRFAATVRSEAEDERRPPRAIPPCVPNRLEIAQSLSFELRKNWVG